MTMTDPIADMLTRIRNANTANHKTVDVPASRVKQAIAQILRDEGFIEGFERIDGGPQGTIRIALRYGPEKEKIITGLRRISRPGLRVYTPKTEIPRVLGGLGLVIISTPQGIMSGKRAKKQGVIFRKRPHLQRQAPDVVLTMIDADCKRRSVPPDDLGSPFETLGLVAFDVHLDVSGSDAVEKMIQVDARNFQ